MHRFMALYAFITLLFAWSNPLQAQDGVMLSNKEICQGDSVNLGSLVNGTIQAFHSWSISGKPLTTDNSNYMVSPESTTDYTLDYTANGQREQKTLTVTVYQTPKFTIPGNHNLCSGNPVTLYANVQNGGDKTSILWKDNLGQLYSNNTAALPITLESYTYTATVHNHSMCPEVTKSFTVTMLMRPTDITIGEVNTTNRQCQGVAFDLNNLIDFYVKDGYGNTTPGTVESGRVTWYATYEDSGPLPSSTITINSTQDRLFWAEYNNIEVCYTNECTSNEPDCRTFTGKQRYPVLVRMSNSTFSVMDNLPCRGDWVSATYQVRDALTYELSTCDAIDQFRITEGDRKHTIKKIANNQWNVEFEPLTGADDSIMVELISKSGAVATYTHKLLHNEPVPIPHPENFTGGYPTVCKGNDVIFYIMANKCDDIKEVTFTGLEKYDYTTRKERNDLYEIKVPKLLDDSLKFTYTVTYRSDYNDRDSTVSGTYTLALYNYPPSVDVTVNNGRAFSARPNLCLGDSLTYWFYPGTCNQLTGSTMTGARQSASYTSHHQYVFKPESPGTYNMTTTITYRRPTDTGDSTYTFHSTVNVVERPYLFINNQYIDTAGFCDKNEADSVRLTNIEGPINYSFVETGSAYFSDWGPASYSIRPIINPVSYNVSATYKYMCSDMTSLSAYGILHIVSDVENLGSTIPPYPDFCVTSGINIPATPLGSTKLTWRHGEHIISFPYKVNPGNYTLTFTATNSCLVDGVTYELPATVVAEPVVQTMPDTAVCYGSNITLDIQPGHIGEITWSTPSPVTITETMVFTATASNVCGSVYDDVEIARIPDVMVQAMSDTSVCYGDSIPLTIIACEGTLTWYDRYGTIYGDPPIVTIKADEEYTVTARNKCGEISDFLNVKSLALPFVEVARDTFVCYGEPFIPQVRRSVGTLFWEPDMATNVTGPLTFMVTAVMEKCGSHSDTLYLDLYPSLELQPVSLPAYKRLKPYALQFEALHSEPPLQYTISGGLPPGMIVTPDGLAGAPMLGPHDFNTYALHVEAVDAHNCKVSGDYTLMPEWSAPTAFTPLENNGNSIFLPGFQVEIYTRNGILIFKGANGWDGRSAGSLVSAGTYFYKATAVFDDIVKQYTGYTTVMY